MRKLACALGAVCGLALGGAASAATFLFDVDANTTSASFNFDIDDQDPIFDVDPTISVTASGQSDAPGFQVLLGSGGLSITSSPTDDEIDGPNGDRLTLTFNRRVRLENVVFAQIQVSDNVDFLIDGRDVDVAASSAASLSNNALPPSDRPAFYSDATFTADPTDFFFTGSASTSNPDGKSFTFFGPDATDDFSIFAVTVVAAIPVPATLPLMIVALGGIGFAARRRQVQQTAD